MSDEIAKLEQQIRHHKARYYQGRPEISDIEYDQIEERLRVLCPESEILKMVGAIPTSLDKVFHEKKMLSLEKTYLVDELFEWADTHDVISMHKIDGVSCSLIYQEGKLLLAKTRGDGQWGENITAKVRWMPSIPTVLPEDNLEVRGELFCTEDNFFDLATEMVALGLERPTSPRNIVAGLISRKDHLELCRYISFKAFDCIGAESLFTREIEKFEKLKQLSFDIPEYCLHKNKDDIRGAIEDAKNFMSNGTYQIDGLVFVLDELKLHKKLGETAHHPRYKLAFKFAGEIKQTKIKEIVWAVSRNGNITPVAEVEPVELSGAVISRVTLHNYGMVRQYNLKKGDLIEIIRSGEVIPKFVSVISESNEQWSIPELCPSCLAPVKIETIRLVCSNKKCPGRIKDGILNYIQKIGIDDLSTKRLEEMIGKGLISGIADLYRLNREKLLALDKVKDKLADKLLVSIEKSKQSELPKFLSALGIAGGAYNKSEKIVSAGFNTIQKIKELTVEQLTTVESFAQKSASEFIRSLREKLELIEELQELGFKFIQSNRSKKLNNKKICITGPLSEKRSIIEQRIHHAGGQVVSAVSANTDWLLTNELTSSSSKFKKAKQLNIAIISEKEFLNLLEGE